MRIDHVQLAMPEGGEPEAEPDFRAAEKAHPAFVVHELDELASRLAVAGSLVTWDTAVPGVDRLYSTDPFGNRLEFIRAGHGFSDGHG